MAITFLTNEDKAELLSKINEAASSGDGLEREIVDVLPTTGIKVDTVYLIPTSESESSNRYDEYVFIPNEGSTAAEDETYSDVDGVWEIFGGSGDVDLTEIDNRINEFSEAIADKLDKSGGTMSGDLTLAGNLIMSFGSKGIRDTTDNPIMRYETIDEKTCLRFGQTGKQLFFYSSERPLYNGNKLALLKEIPDAYTKEQIDVIMGAYINDIDALVGGEG